LNSAETAAPYDVAFVGHVCYDEVTLPDAPTQVRPGSAVLCGAAVAARVGARTAVVTRMNPKDDAIVTSLRALGVRVHVVPTAVTTIGRVVHRSADMDTRELFVPQDAGPFTPADLPAGLRTGVLHLAGISNHEFTLDLVRRLRAAGFALGLDLQGFVRVVGDGGRIVFSDVPDKRELAACVRYLKMDIVEAELLTGTRDLAQAARIAAGWGAPEVLITEQAGATLMADGRLYRAAFTNRSQAGRTGRGDTTMSAYLCRRRTHGPAEALRFAAALVSIKMETPGPFVGTLEDVERRMAEAQ
jgi:sugar/nucleoside kinase (ribokinase family)